jgi:hypothetical protein
LQIPKNWLTLHHKILTKNAIYSDENDQNSPEIESKWPANSKIISQKIQLEQIILSKTGTAPQILENISMTMDMKDESKEQNCEEKPTAISVDCKMF